MIRKYIYSMVVGAYIAACLLTSMLASGIVYAQLTNYDAFYERGNFTSAERIIPGTRYKPEHWKDVKNLDKVLWKGIRGDAP